MVLVLNSFWRLPRRRYIQFYDFLSPSMEIDLPGPSNGKTISSLLIFGPVRMMVSQSFFALLGDVSGGRLDRSEPGSQLLDMHGDPRLPTARRQLTGGIGQSVHIGFNLAGSHYQSLYRKRNRYHSGIQVQSYDFKYFAHRVGLECLSHSKSSLLKLSLKAHTRPWLNLRQ